MFPKNKFKQKEIPTGYTVTKIYFPKLPLVLGVFYFFDRQFNYSNSVLFCALYTYKRPLAVFAFLCRWIKSYFRLLIYNNFSRFVSTVKHEWHCEKAILSFPDVINPFGNINNVIGKLAVSRIN